MGTSTKQIQVYAKKARELFFQNHYTFEFPEISRHYSFPENYLKSGNRDFPEIKNILQSGNTAHACVLASNRNNETAQ